MDLPDQPGFIVMFMTQDESEVDVTRHVRNFCGHDIMTSKNTFFSFFFGVKYDPFRRVCFGWHVHLEYAC